MCRVCRACSLTGVLLEGKIRNGHRSTLIVASNRQTFPHLPKWRNWQTRYIQGVVPDRAWRFESSLRHQLFYSLCACNNLHDGLVSWCL